MALLKNADVIKKRKIEEPMIRLFTLIKDASYRIRAACTAWKGIVSTVMVTTLNCTPGISASVN